MLRRIFKERIGGSVVCTFSFIRLSFIVMGHGGWDLFGFFIALPLKNAKFSGQNLECKMNMGQQKPKQFLIGRTKDTKEKMMTKDGTGPARSLQIV